VTAAESRMFWLSLVVCQALWIVFCVGSIFTFNFKWTVSTLICIVHNSVYDIIMTIIWNCRNWNCRVYSE